VRAGWQAYFPSPALPPAAADRDHIKILCRRLQPPAGSASLTQTAPRLSCQRWSTRSRWQVRWPVCLPAHHAMMPSPQYNPWLTLSGDMARPCVFCRGCRQGGCQLPGPLGGCSAGPGAS
jgi:hypothetical protein